MTDYYTAQSLTPANDLATGSYYLELYPTGFYWGFGVGAYMGPFPNSGPGNVGSVGISGGYAYAEGIWQNYAPTPTTGDVVGVAINNGNIWFRQNTDSWTNGSNPTSGS
jgi:hypothetical protein